MTDRICHKCEKGHLRSQVVTNFETRLRGVSVTIPEAHIHQCDNCGEQVFSAKEIHRWEALQISQLRTVEALPDSNRIKQIRADLCLNVSQFADFVGVTRQTVHAWERPNGGPGLSPAALLLQLVYRELTGSAVRVVDALKELASARGQKLPVAAKAENEEPPQLGRDVIQICDYRKRRAGAPSFVSASM